MHYRDKFKLWKTAYYLVTDQGAAALPAGEPQVQSQKGGGQRFVEWAIDLRNLVPSSHLVDLDHYYLQPSNDYRPVPVRIKRTVRKLWIRADARGLIEEGGKIVEKIYG